MAERGELAPGLVIAGRYRVEQLLGKGGMGAVYVVSHVHTEEKLALKVLHSTEAVDGMALERFQREARAPAKIDSDHVVRVTDADVAKELDGAPFLVMELLKGRGLDHELAEQTRLTPETTVQYLRQLARALDKAHKLGIVHRDLKPENIFLSMREDGTTQVKVLDFGIAKLTKQEVGSGAKTATGALTGTPFYMAPEQLKGDNAHVAAHTDVWAVGIIAHKLLTGEDFWTATTVTQLVGQICYEPVPSASARGASFGQAYDQWFAKCCARNFEDRFASVGEAVEALATALGVAAPAALQSSSSGAQIPRAVVSARPLPMRSSADGLARTEYAAPRRGPPKLFIAATLVAAGSIGGLVVYVATRSPKVDPVPAAAPPAVSTAPSVATTAPPAATPTESVAPAASSAPAATVAPHGTTKSTARPTARPDAGHGPSDQDLLKNTF